MKKYQLWYNETTRTYAMLTEKFLNEPIIARTSVLVHEFRAESDRQAELIRSRATAAHKQRVQTKKRT